MTGDKDFFAGVYKVCRLIPRGRVSTYGAIARALGTPGAARMVGWALNKSFDAKPSVPAHRVVNRQGLLSGKKHFGDPTMMQKLLEEEGIPVKDDKVSNFREVFWDPLQEIEP